MQWRRKVAKSGGAKYWREKYFYGKKSNPIYVWSARSWNQVGLQPHSPTLYCLYMLATLNRWAAMHAECTHRSSELLQAEYTDIYKNQRRYISVICDLRSYSSTIYVIYIIDLWFMLMIRDLEWFVHWFLICRDLYCDSSDLSNVVRDSWKCRTPRILYSQINLLASYLSIFWL